MVWDIIWSRGGGYLFNFLPSVIFPNFSAFSKHWLLIEYHIHIWQVSPQLSCGDTCQIWMWFNRCYYNRKYKSEISLMEKLINGARVTPTPKFELKKDIPFLNLTGYKIAIVSHILKKIDCVLRGAMILVQHSNDIDRIKLTFWTHERHPTPCPSREGMRYPL